MNELNSFKRINALGVHIIDLPYSADIEYTYLIPLPLMNAEIRIGSFVCVPFGRANKLMTAVVTSATFLKSHSKLKQINGILGDTVIPFLSDEMLKLAFYMKDTTFCSIGDAIRAFLPSGSFGRVDVYYVAVPESKVSDGEPLAKEIYRFLIERYIASESSVKGKPEKGVFITELYKRFGKEIDSSLSVLISSGAATKEYTLGSAVKPAMVEYAELTRPYDDQMSIALSGKPKQRQIVKYIAENGAVSLSDIRESVGGNSKMLVNLVKMGIIRIINVSKQRNPYDLNKTGDRENILSDEQNTVFEKIKELADSGSPAGALLYGVTGSGKTRVMKSAIDHVISSGKSVIVLVPEISLTPQTVSLFSSFYGNDIAVLHSSLSLGERYDEWRKIKDGQAKICIGTRSAIFAPFEKLGLIIIDEEQEHTYKSEMSPRYHARDIARFRAAYHNAVMLLASATPSVESYYKALNGTYTLLELNKRYGNAVLPETYICDMRGRDITEPIGDILAESLKETVSSGEQSILFVNRRGYSNFASCSLCGEIIKCPSCSVSLTYHTRLPISLYKRDSLENRIEGGYLMCHYCGYKSPVPSKCPACSSKVITFQGYGTQYVETKLKDITDKADVLRMDADTTTSKFSFDSMLTSFREKKHNILLGTQMVTKGHDFPDVTLVGVINADIGLNIADYRASERIFSLITQVIGRAGRANKKGRAVIQTLTPDSHTLHYAACQDYKAFYSNEIAVRHALSFPPFCDIAVITLSSDDEAALDHTVEVAMEKLKEILKGEYSDLPVQVFGPMEAPIYKLKDKLRMKIVIKCRSSKRMRRAFAELLEYVGKNTSSVVSTVIDINPSTV